MTAWNHYLIANSIPEALTSLASAPGAARFVAGGTDLLLDLQQGRHPPVHTLIDVTAIPELTALEIRQGQLYIGAGVPHKKIIAAPLVSTHAQALTEACGLIGGPQVRNTATLGGNVAHALPAADGTIALLALNARAETISLRGASLRPMQELFLGPGKSALEARQELLVGFYLPLKNSGEGSAFKRVMRPQGVAIAILNLSAWVRREGEWIVDVRLGIGPAGPTPFRALAAEEALRGKIYRPESVDQALQALLASAHFRTSPHRATADYRRHTTGVLLRDTLAAAWERAAQP